METPATAQPAEPQAADLDIHPQAQRDDRQQDRRGDGNRAPDHREGLRHAAEQESGPGGRQAGQRQQQRERQDATEVACQDDARDGHRLVAHGPYAFSVTRYSRYRPVSSRVCASRAGR